MRLRAREFPILLEGILYSIPPAVITLILGFGGKVYLFLPFLLLTLFVLSFFRNPPRKIPNDEGLILSPADGRIVCVEIGAEVPSVGGKATKISIFMSPFNVHVNRVPAGGMIEDIRYQKGRFLPAKRGEASQQNEQNAVILKTDEGLEMAFVQVAGILARRIICYVRRGNRVQRGEVFGAIVFGSRVDIYLPKGVEVMVSMGDRVKGGRSILGVIR